MENHRTYLYRRIVEAKLFMDENYANAIPTKIIAGVACFSEFHFLRLFKEVYQITPHQYLTSIRIKKAKQMLRNGSLITETCALVGFDSMSSFIKLFKKHVKLTPSVYAALVKERHQEIRDRPLAFVPDCFIEYMHWNK